MLTKEQLIRGHAPLNDLLFDLWNRTPPKVTLGGGLYALYRPTESIFDIFVIVDQGEESRNVGKGTVVLLGVWPPKLKKKLFVVSNEKLHATNSHFDIVPSDLDIANRTHPIQPISCDAQETRNSYSPRQRYALDIMASEIEKAIRI